MTPLDAKRAAFAKHPEIYIREHAHCIAIARKARMNIRTDYPQHALAWSRREVMHALKVAANRRRNLAEMRAPKTILVVDAQSIAAHGRKTA